MRMIDWPRRGLYLITPDDEDTERLAGRLARALEGGPALVQYRSKLRSAALRREQAGRVAELCRRVGVPLIINDSLELALEVEADGVHLGRDDGDVVRARRRLGARSILGVSCYDEWDRAERGWEAGADYVAFGAMFPSLTKPEAVRAPMALLGHRRPTSTSVVAAIGGITLERGPQLIAAGADLLAVIGDVFDAPDPGARVAAWRALFDRTANGPARVS